jgi:hypothetical protein
MNDAYTQRQLEQMLEWAQAHSDDWRVKDKRDKRGLQLRTLLARSTETFAAAVLLTGQGFGRQAIMLSGPLFEDMVLACWIKWIADPDLVTDRLADQHRHSALIWDDLAEKYPSLPRPPLQYNPTQAERERYETLFGKSGTKTWWAVDKVEEATDPKPGEKRYKASGRTRSLKTLIDELDKKATSRLIVAGSDPRPPRELIRPLRYLHDVVNRVNNQTLHYTSQGNVLAYDDAAKSWREGPWEYLVPMALSTLVMTYDKLIFVMLQHGNKDLEQDYIEFRRRALGDHF